MFNDSGLSNNNINFINDCIFNANETFKIEIKDKDFDKLLNKYFKLYSAYSILMRRALGLTRCRKRIFFIKFFIWKNIFEKILRFIINGKEDDISFIEIENILSKCLIENNLAHEKLVRFFVNFHKQLSVAYVSYFNEILKDKKLSKIKKICKLVDEYIELLNISLLELEHMDISCNILCEYNKCVDSCNECGNMSNIITLIVVPEYFKFKGVFDKLIDAFKMIKNKDKIILIIDYQIICRRNKKYDFVKNNGYERYKKVLNYVKDIFFINYSCVDFGECYDKLKNKLIKSKYELLKLKNENINGGI